MSDQIEMERGPLADGPRYTPLYRAEHDAQQQQQQQQQQQLDPDAVGLLVDAVDELGLLTLQRGFLLVRGSLGRRYWVSLSAIATLEDLNAPTYCLHARDRQTSPLAQLAAVKLLIETNERRFLRLANVDRQLTGADRLVLLWEIHLYVRFGRELIAAGTDERRQHSARAVYLAQPEF